MSPKYIFIIGGVLSGLGKGIATSSIGLLLKSRGWRVTALKIDPYINVDAGTMNPLEHGEVFVTQDGMETDQDIGNYERFLDQELTRDNYMTTGQVYQTVIQKERNLAYGGHCVQVVPHIPQEVIRRLKKVARKTGADFVLVEIGGTVGEYENLLFLEAARMMHLKNPEDVLFILVSYLPIPSKIGEMKTKPTQHATRSLNSAGIQPDFILARAEKPLDKPRKEKISIFCNIAPQDVISAPDVDSVYEVPLNFEKEGLTLKILKKMGQKSKKRDLKKWQELNKVTKNISKKIRIGLVGKYFTSGAFVLADSYISVIEAIKHAAWFYKVEPEMEWIDSEEFEKGVEAHCNASLQRFDGLIVPGGFGSRGVEGKIKAIQFCREKKKPFLGLCFGMQLASLEFARNVVGLKKAHSTEIVPETSCPVIHLMPEQEKKMLAWAYGGTMRLGDWPCRIKQGTISAKAYEGGLRGKNLIKERHRHRYEFNNAYREKLAKAGLVIAGTTPDDKLVEIIELKHHPFFVATQFHPEFKSRPLRPHPLFREFIRVCLLRRSV